MMTDWLAVDDEPLHALPLYASAFAKSSSGGSDDDLDDDDGDEDDDLDDDEDDDDPDAEKSVEDLREELKATREAIKKANDQSKRRRLREREAKAQAEADRLARAAKKPKSGGGPEEVDVESVREEARREGEKAGNDRAKRSEVRAALATAGVPEGRLAAAVGLIKLDDLELDDDGLDGIDEAIAQLKVSLPELFPKARRRGTSIAGDGDRDGDKQRKKPLTASERQALVATQGR